MRRLTSTKDIYTCIDMYISKNDYTFLPADRAVACSALASFLKANDFIRVLEEDDNIYAWCLFKQVRVPHMPVDVFQQVYFASSAEGLKAVRAIHLLHDAAVEEARRRNLKYVTSAGSHMDEKNVFVRILERHGWLRRGHIAVYHLPAHAASRTIFDRN